jgi:glycosyltransferase involved in cell wall biosynthesis
LIARFPPDWRVLFIETYVVGKPNRFRARRDGIVTYLTVPFLKGTPYRLINRLQESYVFRILFTRIALWWVRIACCLTGFTDPNRVFICSNIYFADILEKLKRRTLIYDCNDYPMGFPGALSVAERYFKKMIQSADAVACVSARLLQDVRVHRSSGCHVVGNGVDYELFSSAGEREEPEDVRTLRRPILLYCGAVSEWFDIDLVMRMARTFEGSSVVIVGPILTSAVRSRLPEADRCGNIFFLGARDHRDLPAYIRQSAVCLIPFLRTPLIERFNPNKLYEYLAAGRPVVTLDYTDEIKAMAGAVHVARDADEFMARIAEALERPPDEHILKEAARPHRWEEKARLMIELFKLDRNSL